VYKAILSLFILINLTFSSAYTKIYDCFLFFNEFEILEIRLEELYEHVDHFVLLEASETFSGLKKPFYFEETKEKYKRFIDKIIHIKLNETVSTDNPWVREHFQRDQLIQGLENCAPNDIILLSDVDKCISGDQVELLKEELAAHSPIGFYHQPYRYFLNRKDPNISQWAGLVALYYKQLAQSSPQKIRSQVIAPNQIENNKEPFTFLKNGWHFSSMGGNNRVYQKWKSFSHFREMQQHNWQDEMQKTYLCLLTKPILNLYKIISNI
jgi:hypothetical protein